MSEISKYWVMIPIGFNDEHRGLFIENCNKINPMNDAKLLESKWEMLVKRNVLQIVIDIRTGATVCSMASESLGTSWQLSKDIIKTITNIKNYTPLSDEEMNDSREYETGVAVTTQAKKAPQYDVDDILDKISSSGYTSLSVEEKDFLTTLK
tara:strand:- start:42 stop:497 length:456 start_codon:yes stop_codon:yes gene_type:complete